MGKLNTRGNFFASSLRGRGALVALTTLLGLQAVACQDEPESEKRSWEEFQANSLVGPAEPGLYRIEGDILTSDVSKLRLAYQRTAPPGAWVEPEDFGGSDRAGLLDFTSRSSLSYCVSNSGSTGWTDASEHARIVQAMHDAEVRWERAASVDFIHDSSRDGDCVDGTSGVSFAIHKQSDGPGCGAAFLPDEPAHNRKVWISHSELEGCDDVVQTFTHQLGHVLGAMHED